jgi:hypothetical protein
VNLDGQTVSYVSCITRRDLIRTHVASKAADMRYSVAAIHNKMAFGTLEPRIISDGSKQPSRISCVGFLP